MNVGWLAHNHNVLGICVSCRSGKSAKPKLFNHWRISLKLRQDDSCASTTVLPYEGDTNTFGIVHMSGVTKDALHASQNPHSIRSTFAPKTGSFSCSKTHLHHAMLVSIVFSSLAVFGSIGQANYSSANATLDMMSAHKKASGMNIVSTRWGAWSAVGMAIDTRRISANTAFMPSINPHLALDILKNLAKTT